MTTTRTTHETVSNVQESDVLLERPGHAYRYLGRDAESYHHHVDEALNTIYVTRHSYEQFLPEDACVYWVRVRGDPVHIEHLDQYDRTLEDWIAYVETVHGWADRPTDYGAILADVLRGGIE